MSKWKKEIKKRDYEQLEMLDFPLKKYECPVSKEIFENRFVHKETCRYKYCKEGWEFSNEIAERSLKNEMK